MELDPVLLSRLQFAFVIAFHILLPAFTVGLASYIVVLEGLYFWRDDSTYLRLSLFWTRRCSRCRSAWASCPES